MRKFIVGIIVVVLGIRICYANGMFIDVEQRDWFCDNVYKLVEAGIVSGYPDGTFQPSQAVTVDQFVKMVLTSLGHANIKNGDEYWASEYIKKAEQIGLVKSNEFLTSNNQRQDFTVVINREQMAMIINRALANENKVIKTEEDLKAYSTLVTDYRKINEYHKSAVTEVYAKGILAGYPDGTFKPTNSLTRAESSTVILRMIDKTKRLSVDKPVVNQTAKVFENKDYYIPYYFELVGNEIHYQDDKLTYTDYRLKEDHNPDINKQVYNAMVSLLTNPIEGTKVGTDYSKTMACAQVTLGGKMVLNGSYNFGYNFYDDKDKSLNIRTGWQEPKFSTNTMISLDVSSLWRLGTFGKDANYLDDAYAVKLRTSLKAIFGESTGDKIYFYVLEKYTDLRINRNLDKKQREVKVIDGWTINFCNGIEPYGDVKFYFTR